MLLDNLATNRALRLPIQNLIEKPLRDENIHLTENQTKQTMALLQSAHRTVHFLINFSK
ncbi:hypothetical protein JHK84_055784 [Glycine max]|nr:hypothetical protein JHK84_055784 [Glycine max]